MVKINVVLVRTKYSSNIGAAARAMANMGGSRLILVDPKTDINSKAKQGAASAQEPLQQATSYSSWEDFYRAEGDGIRIAFSRRGGKRRPLIPLRPLMKRLSSDHQSDLANKPIYLIFGPEDHGLNADDMAFVNYCSSLPTYGKFASLNLSQAVLLAIFITAEELMGDPDDTKTWQSQELDTRVSEKQMVFPDQSIRQWLEAMGFDIEARKASAYITLKRLLLQNLPTENELMVLEAILQQNIRKLLDGKSNEAGVDHHPTDH